MADLTTGRGRKCPETLGGNSAVYLINYIESPFTVSATTNEATAINAGILEVFKYILDNDGNTLTQPTVGDKQTGTRVNTQTLTLTLTEMTVADSAEFNLLAAGCAIAVVRTRNNKYIACGITDGMSWTIESATGGAQSDFNGYTVTGTARENKLAPYLDAATIVALEALV
jgi:N-methylhydantoinase B/oxoprolinase/acetone carboxylase alpha subunit